MMQYRSIAQLSHDVRVWSRTLPQDIDLVVGVPRSGLLAAQLLAMYRNLPLTDLDGLLAGRLLVGGSGEEGAESLKLPPGTLRVLVVDDTVRSGQAMHDAKERLAAAATPHRYYFGAVYMRPGVEEHVDFFHSLLDLPRRFEWNILHRRMNGIGVVMDGVICPELPVPHADDPSSYREYLSSVEPLHLPSRTIDWLISTRPERLRAPTEEWLAKYGVTFAELVMLKDAEYPTARSGPASCVFKAEVLGRKGARMLIEPSLFAAIQIANLASKPVFCADTRQMIYPGMVPRDRYGTPDNGARHGPLATLRTRVRSLILRHRIRAGSPKRG